MINKIGMGFIPVYNIEGPFLFIMSPMLMVGRIPANYQSASKSSTIARNRGSIIWMLAAFWGMLVQLAVPHPLLPSTG
jgi:hypothetical protein